MSGDFVKEQLVVYGKMGVCRVVGRQMLAFGSAEKMEYYILAPLHDPRSSVYVPCNNAALVARLRPLLTREEIDALLARVPQEEILWIEDRGERAAHFRAVLNEGDRRQVVRLVRCLLTQKAEKNAAGKRLAASDEAILQDCVRLVEEEFALVLAIPTAAVGAYIEEKLGE